MMTSVPRCPGVCGSPSERPASPLMSSTAWLITVRFETTAQLLKVSTAASALVQVDHELKAPSAWSTLTSSSSTASDSGAPSKVTLLAT